MLDRVDRMLLAVRACDDAAATFAHVLGAQKVRDDSLGAPYGARRVVVQAGDSEFELLEPAGEGLVAQHLERWREGIFGAGFSTSNLAEIERSLNATGVAFERHGSQIFIEPGQTRGMRTVVQESEQRSGTGLISGLYEVTNVADDHEEAAAFYARAFGLDQSRFCPIHSDMWGYGGTLTLFDPPAKLDRIEITQITEPSRAMGRYYERRGQSVYMCFVESRDVGLIQERLDATGGRYQPINDFPGAGLFIHPSALCGMLMGVSYTNVAWRWSGRPDLAPAARS